MCHREGGIAPNLEGKWSLPPGSGKEVRSRKERKAQHLPEGQYPRGEHRNYPPTRTFVAGRPLWMIVGQQV